MPDHQLNYYGKLGVWDKHIHTTVYKLVNKDLLYSAGNYTQYLTITCNGYSAGNYTQYLTITCNGRDSEKLYTHTHTHTYITEPPCYIFETK